MKNQDECDRMREERDRWKERYDRLDKWTEAVLAWAVWIVPMGIIVFWCAVKNGGC